MIEMLKGELAWIQMKRRFAAGAENQEGRVDPSKSFAAKAPETIASRFAGSPVSFADHGTDDGGNQEEVFHEVVSLDVADFVADQRNGFGPNLGQSPPKSWNG